MAGVDIAKVRSILNLPDVTDTTIEQTLREKGITTQAAADKWAQQNAGPSQPGAAGNLRHNAAHATADLAAWLTDSIRSSGKKGKGDRPAELGPQALAYEKQKGGEGAVLAQYGKDTAASQAKERQALEQKAIQAQIQAVENSPWTKLSNALTQQYAQEMTPILSAVSGATGPSAVAAAGNQALASLGLGPNSSAGQWLSSQTAAEQATTAPVAAAMGQEAKQMEQGIGPITQALLNYGQANALEVETAPEAGWLNALTSHITSNLSYYGLVPKAALPSLSPSVAKALQLSGGYGGSAGAGTVPLQNVVPATGGGTTARVPTVGAGTSSYGAVPGTTVAPQG